jgi:exonuclease III
MDNINISTLNVRGFNRKTQVSFVYDFLLKYNIDILFIQETLVRNLNIISFIKNTFNDYDFFFKATEENTGGLAIFVEKSDKVFINNEFFDNENRMYGIYVNISGFQFNLINIYSPNSPTSQNEFT